MWRPLGARTTFPAAFNSKRKQSINPPPHLTLNIQLPPSSNLDGWHSNLDPSTCLRRVSWGLQRKRGLQIHEWQKQFSVFFFLHSEVLILFIFWHWLWSLGKSDSIIDLFLDNGHNWVACCICLRERHEFLGIIGEEGIGPKIVIQFRFLYGFNHMER